MVGWKKAAAVIQQCTRCFCLRDLKADSGDCKSCRHLLNISHRETRPLAFMDSCTDMPPVLTVSDATISGTVSATGRLACIN